MYDHLLCPFFFTLLNDFTYSFLFPGLGGVLRPLLHQPLDASVSDRGLLECGRRHTEGVHQQSQPQRCLQELTGVSSCFVLFLFLKSTNGTRLGGPWSQWKVRVCAPLTLQSSLAGQGRRRRGPPILLKDLTMTYMTCTSHNTRITENTISYLETNRSSAACFVCFQISVHI